MEEETNPHGRSGLTMEPNARWLSLWKKMLGLRCSSFSRRLFASCLSHWHQPFTRHSHQTPLVLSSLKQTPLHRPHEWIQLPMVPSETHYMLLVPRLICPFQPPQISCSLISNCNQSQMPWFLLFLPFF